MLQTIETLDNDDTYKLTQLRLFCQELQIAEADCMCVGDGENDVLLFDATGCGVTFMDSPVAHRAKYTINSLRDLPSLVT